MTIDSLRRWLRSDMRIMRWVLLALYLLLIASLFSNFWDFTGATLPLVWLLAMMFVAQALFIFGAGTIQLCRPIRKRRLLIPVVIAALMLAILLGGLALALLELFEVDEVAGDAAPWVFWGVLVASWIGWGIVLFAHVRNLPRFKALTRLANLLIGGSLLELLASVPSHLIVARRPGCLVGIGTMTGIIAGVSVMLFAFGPALFLLFLRPRYRREQMTTVEAPPMCDVCGYDLRASRERCPECGTPFPFPGTISQRR